MTFRIKRKAELAVYLQSMFILTGLEKEDAELCVNVLEDFVKSFDEDLFIGIEFPYVDKLYRDSYYNYYSSKLRPYFKNCVRLSFFTSPITHKDFMSRDRRLFLQKNFLGFLVLRPTPPNIIGRNFFKPSVFLKAKVGYVATTQIEPTINGVKLKIEGFPHCSQDSEMMVCAETTIWSIMEYFSNRYSDYKSVLPHDINNILANKSVQRQTPSLGLTAYHMSYVIKKLGFGVRMYSTESYSLPTIFKIIQIYVESGIPVMTTIANANVGHVLNIVGRTEFNNRTRFTFTSTKALSSGSYLYDFYQQSTKYLVIDDNLSPYSQIPLSKPAINYARDLNWKGCKIDSCIVPLHSEIYMEADMAVELVESFLQGLDEEIGLPSLVIRIFLSSCRSFKNFISQHNDIHDNIKRKIINIDMPKFVYLAELGLPMEVYSGKASGIIILDATEPRQPNFLGFFFRDLYLDSFSKDFKMNIVTLQPFERFNNLQKF